MKFDYNHAGALAGVSALEGNGSGSAKRFVCVLKRSTCVFNSAAIEANSSDTFFIFSEITND